MVNCWKSKLKWNWSRVIHLIPFSKLKYLCSQHNSLFLKITSGSLYEKFLKNMIIWQFRAWIQSKLAKHHLQYLIYYYILESKKTIFFFLLGFKMDRLLRKKQNLHVDWLFFLWRFSTFVWYWFNHYLYSSGGKFHTTKGYCSLLIQGYIYRVQVDGWW